MPCLFALSCLPRFSSSQIPAGVSSWEGWWSFPVAQQPVALSQLRICARLSCVPGTQGQLLPTDLLWPTVHGHSWSLWPWWQVSPAQHPGLINSPFLYKCSWRGSCGPSHTRIPGILPTQEGNKASGHNTPKKSTDPLHVCSSPVCQARPNRGGGRRVSADIGGSAWGQPARHLGPRGQGGALAAVGGLFSTPRHTGEESVAEQLLLLQLSCQLHSSWCHSYLQDFSLTHSITIQKSPWRKVSACWFVSLSFASSAGEGRKKAINNQLACFFSPFYFLPPAPFLLSRGVKSSFGRSFSSSMHGRQQIGRGEQPAEDVSAGRAVPWEWSSLCVQARQWVCSLPLWVHLFLDAVQFLVWNAFLVKRGRDVTSGAHPATDYSYHPCG